MLDSTQQDSSYVAPLARVAERAHVAEIRPAFVWASQDRGNASEAFLKKLFLDRASSGVEAGNEEEGKFLRSLDVVVVSDGAGLGRQDALGGVVRKHAVPKQLGTLNMTGRVLAQLMDDWIGDMSAYQQKRLQRMEHGYQEDEKEEGPREPLATVMGRARKAEITAALNAFQQVSTGFPDEFLTPSELEEHRATAIMQALNGQHDAQVVHEVVECAEKWLTVAKERSQEKAVGEMKDLLSVHSQLALEEIKTIELRGLRTLEKPLAEVVQRCVCLRACACPCGVYSSGDRRLSFMAPRFRRLIVKKSFIRVSVCVRVCMIYD